MRDSFTVYCKKQIHRCGEAITNIALFLPYFFSVPTLFRTLFYPWKSIVEEKNERGFSFSKWTEQISFNFVSRAMGCTMRVSILIFYLFIQSLFVILVPFIFLLFLLLLIPRYLLSLVQPTHKEFIAQKEKEFIASHCLDLIHQAEVQFWFAHIYRPQLENSAWYSISKLFSVPPIGRDWANGYTPTLDQYTTDFTSYAFQTKIPNIFGRENELAIIEQILTKQEEANIVIVGEPGVGKDTILQAFARKIFIGQVNPLLMYKRVLQLNLEKILSHYVDQKQKEEFLETLLQEAKKADNIILYIPHLDRYVSYSNGRTDFSPSFEKYANTSALSIIGVTTPEAYETYIFPHEIASQLFTKITVTEVSKSDAFQILMTQASLFESRHSLIIPYETMVTVGEKSDYYITTIPFPEKALQLLEEACIFVKQEKKASIVQSTDVETILTNLTHIPTILTTSLRSTLLHLEDLLKDKIIDQPEAITQVSAAMRRAFLLIGKRKKPLASLLLIGPTGVGKTETAKVLTDLVFHDIHALIRFDMSFYQTKQSIIELVGSTQYQTPGLLTQKLREKPYGVLLLDEIEKADSELRNIFLTILDEGYFTDGAGKRVDCKNLIVIATSNAGTENVFSPEFINRFDGVVSYMPLDAKAIFHVAKHFAQIISEELAQTQKITVTIHDESLQSLINSSYQENLGARDMERILRSAIEDGITKKILSGELKEGDNISL